MLNMPYVPVVSVVLGMAVVTVLPRSWSLSVTLPVTGFCAVLKLARAMAVSSMASMLSVTLMVKVCCGEVLMPSVAWIFRV